jgi:hypothetical protein
VKGERETYLPGSGYNEGNSNNGSGHGGFPLLMFVPCLLACSSPVLVSRRSLFVFALVLCLLRLFFLCVPLVSGFFPLGFAPVPPVLGVLLLWICALLFLSSLL